MIKGGEKIYIHYLKVALRNIFKHKKEAPDFLTENMGKDFFIYLVPVADFIIQPDSLARGLLFLE